MQRGGQGWSRPQVDLAAASQRAQRAQEPERRGRRSADDSNVHSEPVSAGGEGARVFQRSRAGANGRLRVRCILDSEIREKDVPTTRGQEETQHTSRGRSFYCKPSDRGMVAQGTTPEQLRCAEAQVVTASLAVYSWGYTLRRGVDTCKAAF
jgi:hypothetical protein